MKKFFIAGLALLLTNVSFSQAPQQNAKPPQDHPTPPTPEQRWQHESKQISETLSLTQDQLAKIKTAFLEFYKEADAAREKLPPPPPPPPPPLPKEEMDKLVSKRNEQLKQVLTQQQIDKLTQAEKQFHERRKEGPPPPAQSVTPPPTK